MCKHHLYTPQSGPEERMKCSALQEQMKCSALLYLNPHNILYEPLITSTPQPDGRIRYQEQDFRLLAPDQKIL